MQKVRKILSILICFALLFGIVNFNYGVVNAQEKISNTRIYGLNRHITAVEISKNGWNSSDVVFLARDNEYADALAAVPLAYAYDAPILLTSCDSLNHATLSQIRNLRARKVIILGGEHAISHEVEQQLLNTMPSGFIIERIGGSDRYHTGKMIALALAEKQEENNLKKGVLVYGRNFPDALSVASHAAVKGYPILLTDSTYIPEYTLEAIEALNIDEFYAIGGEDVISDCLVRDLNVKRVSGQDRYSTSFEVTVEFNPNCEKVYLATGLDFADAITGAVLAAKKNASIILVNGTEIDYSLTRYLEDREITVGILGGYNAVKYGIWKSEIPNQNSLKYIPRLKPFISYLEYANNNLNNGILVHPTWDPYPIQGMPKWDENPYNSNSWKFYLHSLEHVGFLTTGYEITGNEEYLAKGMEHIISWIGVNGDINEAKSLFAWHDHGSANRVQNMMHLWFHWKDSSLYQDEINGLFIDTIHKHGVFLADCKNYSPYNHGVFQDQALLQISAVFDSFPEAKKWQDLALTRLMTRLKEDVSMEGIHKEHSPMYHLLVINRFTDISSLCNYYEIELPGTVVAYLKLMENYLARVTKPNGYLSHVGDTRRLEIFNRFRDKSVTQLLEYVQSRGRNGTAPKQVDVVYPEAGVALFRDGWGFDDEDLYIMFTSAFHSTIHKHGDDLSFVLSRGETDFLVDGGMYNYVESDPVRQYLRGTLGHNTISVDNQSYSLNPGQIGKAKIIDYGTFEDYSYVVGKHTLYKGVFIERTLIHYKPSTIIVHDRIVSKGKHSYSQMFHVGKDVAIKSASKQAVELTSEISEQSLTIRQMMSVEEIKHYKGEKEPYRGWMSTELNTVFPIDVFHFNISGDTGEFLTLLTFEDSDFVKVKYTDNTYILIDDIGNEIVIEDVK